MQIGNMWGQDLPSKIQLKMTYGDIPVHGGGRQIIDIFRHHKEEFDNVIIIGCDDEGVEQTFDFFLFIEASRDSSGQRRNEQFTPDEVKELLLKELR